MKNRYLILVLFAGLFACKTDDVVPENPLDTAIVGNWNWVKSSGGIQGTTLTPTSTKYSLSYVFTKSNTYQQTKNGALLQEGGYKLQHIFESPSGKLTQKITFLNLNETFVYTLKNDTLRIDEGCCDRFLHIYTKVK